MILLVQRVKHFIHPFSARFTEVDKVHEQGPPTCFLDDKGCSKRDTSV